MIGWIDVLGKVPESKYLHTYTYSINREDLKAINVINRKNIQSWLKNNKDFSEIVDFQASIYDCIIPFEKSSREIGNDLG